MFPIGNGFVFAAYLECAVIGLVLGVASGIVMSLILKVRIRAIAITIDAILGAAGAVITTDALWRIGFQYNFIAAVIVALALPALRHGFHPRRLGTGRN